MTKSKKPIIVIHDLATGEKIEREMTEQEYSEHLTVKAQAEAIQVEAETKEIARQSAIDKLAALGLTADEIAAIVGGNQ